MFWYPMEKDFDAVDDKGLSLKDFLASYDPAIYERPAVTVDNLIFKRTQLGLEVLLIRRGRHPYYGMLGLPGGFIEMHESLEDAAARELQEETGVSGLPLQQLGAYGTLGRDPRLRIVSVAYLTVISKDISCQAGDDAVDAGFFHVTRDMIVKNMETIHVLNFTNGNVTATCRIGETDGKRTILTSELASDHALMVLDGLERIHNDIRM